MESEGGHAPHIVAIPFIWPGHTTPLLHLCRYLASSGCCVTFLKAPDDEASGRGREVWDHGVRVLSALPLGPSVCPPAVQAPDHEQRLQEAERYFTEFESLGDKLLPVFEEISQKSGSTITCIISDVYVGWAQQVAKQLHVEWMALWTSTVSELVVYYHMPQLIKDGVFPFSGPPAESTISLPGLPGLHPRNYPTMELIPSSSLHSVLHRFKEMVQKIPQASRLLVNSTDELESGPIESLRNLGVNVHAVGPLHLLSESEGLDKPSDPDGVLGWLDSKPAASVLYIAFGTTMPMAGQQFEELAYALEESGQEFVWAIRKSIAELLPEGFEKRMSGKEQGKVVSWAPQVEILKHSAVGGFFTHCGWNSVLEAMSNGVPMIARPISGDQVLTRKLLVEEWGIGLGLRGGEHEVADREEIKRVMKLLMVEQSGETVRRKARKVKEQVVKAAALKGSSWNSLSQICCKLNEKKRK